MIRYTRNFDLILTKPRTEMEDMAFLCEHCGIKFINIFDLERHLSCLPRSYKKDEEQRNVKTEIQEWNNCEMVDDEGLMFHDNIEKIDGCNKLGRTFNKCQPGKDYEEFNEGSPLKEHNRMEKFQKLLCDNCGNEYIDVKISKIDQNVQSRSVKKSHLCKDCRFLMEHNEVVDLLQEIGENFDENAHLKKKIQTRNKTKNINVKVMQNQRQLKKPSSILSHKKNRNDKTFKCEHCEAKHKTNDDLLRHLIMHVSERKYEVRLNKANVKHNAEHENLERRLNTNEKSYYCKYCEKKFNYCGTLKRHLRIHTGEKPFECKHCGKKFNLHGNLKRHLMIHTGEKPYECKHCDKKFCENGTLKQHLMIHTGEKPFECKHCDKKFNNRGNFSRHLMIHTGKKPFECKHCGKKFNNRGNFSRHLMIHTGEKPFECKHCDKKFSTNGILKKHLMIHTGEKPYECKHCGKKFNDSGVMKRHLMIHTGKKPFECKHCDKKFNNRGNFNRHLMIHIGKNPYKCNDSLEKHMRIHLRDKVYECKDCGKKFISNQTLTHHLVIHRGEKCECKRCGIKLSHKRNLKRHMRIHERQTTLM